MRKFFKKEEKLPFQFSAIEERRSGTNYFVWIIGIIGVTITRVLKTIATSPG